MEGIARKPFQGITNIVKFNWHLYAIAITLIAALLFSIQFTSQTPSTFIIYFIYLIIFSTLISLSVSYYVYDYSNLYRLDWLNFLEVTPRAQLVNINAGFDETSFLLTKKYLTSDLHVFDFYDPSKHTEVSIERARKAHSVYPNTKSISTLEVPLKACSIDYIFTILAAHEIRSTEERIIFFKGLHDTLKQEGRIVVVEHLRDLPNFIAYNIGFFHFFSKKEWENTFNSSQLYIEKEIKITPFISAFIIKKNGITS
jgi:hypothetical protein